MGKLYNGQQKTRIDRIHAISFSKIYGPASKSQADSRENMLTLQIFISNNTLTLVKMYISLKISVERLKTGFPLKPPASFATGLLLTDSGREIVVFDMI